MSSDQGERTVMASRTVDDQAREDRAEPARDSNVGRYRVARRIGKGGMGEVMGARDEQVGRDVAIKRMRKANPSERAIQRFLREACIQGRLEHPAIVPVHEIGRDPDGLPFFVMKRLSGTTLANILYDPKAAVPLQRVLRAFADVCLAVEFAHVRGIIHRDLKPENIMLGDYGEVYVLDWGVAKVIGDEDDGEFADVGSGTGEHATAAGTAIGTPGYMAPEQVRGAADIDGRADVYTLGCLLFEILAGEPLNPRGFDRPTAGAQAPFAERDARPSARAPSREIPPELDALCAQATAADRTARPTARELGDRVQRYLDGDRDLALRRELAREHFENAQVAFRASGTEDHRRIAMREAAAAMALDPALDGPAELVTRLMLEPPKQTPREVTDAVHAEDVRTANANARAGVWALIAALAFTPFLWWIGPAASGHLFALTALFVLDGVVCLLCLRTGRPWPGPIVVINAVIVVVAALMYSPVFIAPGVAAVLAMAGVLTPRFSILGSAVTIAVMMIVAVLGPLALEYAGVLERTMSVDASGIVFHPPAVAGKEGPSILVSVLYTIGLIAGAAAMADTMRRRTRAAHHHLQLQAWQLGQLVPRSSAA